MTSIEKVNSAKSNWKSLVKSKNPFFLEKRDEFVRKIVTSKPSFDVKFKPLF